MSHKKANKELGRSAFRNIATLLSGTVVAQLIGIATMPILSRIYGPAAFGILAIFLSVSAVVSTVAALRYEFAIVLPKHEVEAVRLRQLALAIVLAISLITIITTVVIFFLTVPADRAWWVLLIGASVFFAGVTNTFFFWMTRGRRYRVQSASRVVQATVTAATQTVLGLFMAPTEEWLIVGYVIGQAASLGVLFFAKDSRAPRSRPDVSQWWELMVRYRKMPFFNAPNALVDALRLNGINVIIGSHSIQSLGQFSMAWKLASGPTGLLANAISQVYFPNLAAAASGTLHRIVKDITIRALAMGFLPMLALALVAPHLVPWFLGSQWEQAGLIVQALVPYLYLTMATAPLSPVFIVTERQGTMLIFAVVYLIIPLTALTLAGHDIVRGAWVLSGAMTVPLVFLIFLTHYVAKRFDRERTSESENSAL